MKIFYRDIKNGYTGPTPSDIGYAIGWLIGKILLFGGGFVAGQVIRGILRAMGFVLPSLF